MALKDLINNNPVVVKFKDLLNRVHVFGGLSLYLLLKTLITKLNKDDLPQISAGIAYNFTLSLFPTMIFLFTLIPYFPVEFIDVETHQINTGMEQLVKDMLPESIFDVMWPTITDIVSKRRTGLLSFGAVMALYLAKNGMMAIMSAFNKIYISKDNRSFIRKQIIALGLTSLLSLSVIISIVALVLGNVIMNGVFEHLNLESNSYVQVFIQFVGFALVLFIFLIIISIIYYFAPTVKKRFSFFSIGSFTATALLILVSKLFSIYVNNFANYNKLYGSIGAFIGLMIFFYAISFIILIGFELNACISLVRDGKVKE